jgi:hypothetical protein
MTLEKFSTSFFGFPILLITPPLFHTPLSLLPEMCDSCNQAKHEHVLGIWDREGVREGISSPVENLTATE